jgi:toxin-antitoxin system PIN domain toxin
VHHAQARDVLIELRRSAAQLAIPSMVISGFIRVATNRRVFDPPMNSDEAIAFVESPLASPTVSVVEPSGRHWTIFRDLVREHALRGPDITDAYLAAMALERGATWVSYDRGFARFRGLQWLNPAAAV